MGDQQEATLMAAFRQMTPDAKNELLRFVISSMVRPQHPKPGLRVVNGKNNA